MIVAIWASGIFLKTIFFSFFSLVIIFNCSSSKKPETPPLSKKSSKTDTVEKKSSKTDQKLTKKKSDDDVKFEIKVKEKVEKKDEFDDDEENPLAKIPTKARLPKAKNAATTPNGTPVVDLNGEAPLLAMNEKRIGASVYAKPR